MAPSDDADDHDLEAPDSVDSLYLALGSDVPTSRALLTGDVLEDIDIPGMNDGGGLAIILTHPCSMRVDGVNLAPRIMVSRVRAYQKVPFDHWHDRHLRVMPLPDLTADGHHAAAFDSIGIVPGDAIRADDRVACLSERGINLLQQRLIYNLTRFVVPTDRLHQSCASVFREVEMQEDWVVAAEDAGVDRTAAEADFHSWIRAEDSAGKRRQERLDDPQALAAITRDLRAETHNRYGS